MTIYTARIMTALFLFAALLFGMPASSPAAKNNPFIVAVLPSAPPVDMHRLWMPFIDRISRDTGLVFRLKVYDKMSEFERDISAGGPDFIFSSPLQAVVGHEAQGYAPLVRGSKPVSAAIIVRKDSPIRSIGDLADKRIAFVGNKNL